MTVDGVNCLILDDASSGGAFGPAGDLPVELREDAIHLWQLDLDRPSEPLPTLAALLDPQEQQRAQRFHFPVHRQRYVVRKAMLRQILARYLAVDAAAIAFVEDDLGKPRLADSSAERGICFNTSHCEGRSVCAMIRDRSIGVDLETFSRSRDFEWPQMSQQFAHPREQNYLRALPTQTRAQAYLRLWTLKEALVKARGQGLSQDLRDLELTSVLAEAGGGWTDASGHIWRFHVLEPDGTAVVSVAVGPWVEPET